ncbi:hypothetical protein QP400_02060 [Winkia sp. UMB3158]|uniref:Uncharacterized protein n=2 Tax=Winkia neuii TaxID=33007 RepID=K0YNY4_9ACTO|nr:MULTISPECIES: hypothetical protein [Winkia]MDK8340366.1 hypothetical protein [Winkia sp. UMB3164B]PLB80174.1 hypothetical protein CYJ21_05760 [Actinomyces sp. UMB0138]EJZ85156.1 hypothetical protein HMPREF9240_01643 [Winkia neuii BV029A5]MCG7302686.1 hypothetical protein [Winkia sp. ACRQY]MDK7148918.1 hypothetical protein [Winkia sp. UMB3158]
MVENSQYYDSSHPGQPPKPKKESSKPEEGYFTLGLITICAMTVLGWLPWPWCLLGHNLKTGCFMGTL